MRQRKKGRLAPSLGLRRPLHESYELFLPLTGALGFEVAGYPYTVKRGSVPILPPNVVHRLLVKESEPLEYLYVQFDPRVIPNDTDLKRAVKDLFHGPYEGEQSMRQLSKERFSYVYTSIRRLCLAGDREVHEQFFRILSPLLHEILLYGVPVSGNSHGTAMEEHPKNALTDQIIEYISQHYADIRDLSFVREVFHYSAVHVNTLLKTRLGVSL